MPEGEKFLPEFQEFNECKKTDAGEEGMGLAACIPFRESLVESL